MKKGILLSFIIFLIIPISVFATPTSYERTDGDLRLPSDVVVDEKNYLEIMGTPSVDARHKIYDFADLLTDAEETKVYMGLNEFTNNTGLDAIIITTDNLNGFQMNEYTYHFYDYNDFQDIGVAFVIYQSPEGPSIFMGNNGPRTSEVFTAYTDSRIQEILKYVYENHIRSGDYYGACEDYIKLIDGFYIKSFGTYKVGEHGEIVKEFPWLEVFVVSLAISFIIIVLMITKYKNPTKRVDQTIKNGLNTKTMVVKCEYNKPISGK